MLDSISNIREHEQAEEKGKADPLQVKDHQAFTPHTLQTSPIN